MACHYFHRRSAAVALLILCWPRPGRSQAFEISGGASTIYGAAGGTLVIHGQDTETNVGAGLENHRFAAGGAMVKRLHDGTETLGLQQVRTDVPTDIFNQAHMMVGVGAGVKVGDAAKGDEIRSFAGMSSLDGGSPLFTSGDLERAAYFTQWTRQVSEECRSVATGSYLRQSLALESLACSLGRKSEWHLAGTAGGGSAGLYGAASAAYDGERLRLQAEYVAAGREVDRGTETYGPTPEPVGANVSLEYKLSRAWTASAAHQQFTLAAYEDSGNPQLDTPAERTSLNQIGVDYHLRGTGVSLSALSSSLLPQNAAGVAGHSAAAAIFGTSNRSFAGTFEHDFGALRWTENLVESTASNGFRETMSISSLALRVNPHLMGSLSADVTDGHVTFAPGGELLTASTSLRVDYELLYVANRPQQPFQQAAVVSAGLRLWHDLAFEVSSAVGPTGVVGYTFRFTTFGARNAPAAQAGMGIRLGDSVLEGMVVDERGQPIEGAALEIDANHLYTDSKGSFCFRERRPGSHLLQVLTADFLTPGDFQVASAPVHVVSRLESDATPVRIVVTRRHTVQVAASSAPSVAPSPAPAPPFATLAEGQEKP